MQNNKDISEKALCAEYNSVYHFALALCKNESDALDITQETFLRAMNSYNKYKGESSLYTWLCAIAKNIWLNKCKRRAKEVYDEDFENDFAPDDSSIESNLDDKDMARIIHRILHTLHEPYKEVFSLRTFGELPFADIAELFSKSESWARVTYHRARSMILDTLRKEGHLDE